jgi:RNA polymerase sigma factor (sigma-70 family)
LTACAIRRVWRLALGRPQPGHGLSPPGAEHVELPDDLRTRHTLGEDRAEEILEVIRMLPEAYRETLVLRLVEGMTGPEIALRTGLTAASVRVNLHRGMKLLRQKLGR